MRTALQAVAGIAASTLNAAVDLDADRIADRP
jgi:hypothetical protein